MSLYAEYIKEREGREIVETADGFATYTWLGEDSCYIVDIYVRPEARKSGVASSLADQVAVLAKEVGCKRLLGSVDPSLPSAGASFMVLLAYGMRPIGIERNLVFFEKEI